MSKYAPLWEAVSKQTDQSFIMSFEQIKYILGFEIDHSFLSYKKELSEYGYTVGKISIKNETVTFNKN